MTTPGSGRPAAAALRMTARVTGAVVGGYALSAALTMLLAVLLARAGVDRSEAVIAAAVAACLIYLLVLLWAFSVRSTGRLWLVMVTGTALAWVATQALRL